MLEEVKVGEYYYMDLNQERDETNPDFYCFLDGGCCECISAKKIDEKGYRPYWKLLFEGQRESYNYNPEMFKKLRLANKYIQREMEL